MGVRILNTGTARAFTGRNSRSAIRLSVAAGLECLKEAGMSIGEIDSLINAGIYRDKHLGEPAIASLIHGGIAKKSGSPVNSDIPGGFFCFDIANGGTGQVNGLEIASGLLESQKIQSALVIAGDALPRRIDRRAFSYSAAASAILLNYSPSGGFRKFFHRSFPAYQSDLTGELRWARKENRTRFQHQLVLSQGPYYLEHCLYAAAETLGEFLLSVNKKIEDFDLLIASLSPPRLINDLEAKLHLPKGLLLVPSNPEGIHTASIGMGLRSAQQSGLLDDSENVLLLSVGAGIQVSVAWYQNPDQ